MFRIRFFTPAVTDANGWRHAGAELVIGAQQLRFTIDLTRWSVADYTAQWREGLSRLAHGAPSSALVTAYRGPHGDRHDMWALWREQDQVYAQHLTVLTAEIEGPFVASVPYAHVGARIPASDQNLPITEYKGGLLPLLAAYFVPRLRLPGLTI